MIDCPDCGECIDPSTVCNCGYEHSCGGKSEACCIPGCPECNHPDLGPIFKGHICRHGVIWPHSCAECDDESYAIRKAAAAPNPKPSPGRAAAPVHEVVGRLPLKRGNRYQFPGYNAGFLVTFVAIPGHPEHDGGLPGVGIQWIGRNFHRRMKRAFYTFKSEAEFWDHHLFKRAADAPNPETSPGREAAPVQRVVGPDSQETSHD